MCPINRTYNQSKQHEFRIGYFFTFNAIVDILTIVPVIIKWVNECPSPLKSLESCNNNEGTGSGKSVLFFRFVRVLRVMRVLRSFRLLNNSLSAVQRQMATLALTILSVAFIMAGCIHLCEVELFPDLVRGWKIGERKRERGTKPVRTKLT